MSAVASVISSDFALRIDVHACRNSCGVGHEKCFGHRTGIDPEPGLRRENHLTVSSAIKACDECRWRHR